MSEVKHVALSASGHPDVLLAQQYEERLKGKGVSVAWTLDPELSKSAEFHDGTTFHADIFVGKDCIRLQDPETVKRRITTIAGAAALVIVSGFRRFTDSGSLWSPYSPEADARWGVRSLGEEPRFDLAVALGAGVPVLMPEGLPSIRSGLERTPYGPYHVERLVAAGVQRTPGDGRELTLDDHVNFVLESIGHVAVPETAR